MNPNTNSSKYNTQNNGPIENQIIGDGHTIYVNNRQKDGIHFLRKGAKALWNGDYAAAKMDLRIAVEEIDGEDQPREASKANYFLALALLDGKLPRTQGRAVMQSIQELMNNAIRLHPCASYYRIFARIKQNFFEHNGFDARLNEVYTLERQGASLPRNADDEENEGYFRLCQPHLWI